MKTKICIADDHVLFRDGLVSLINQEPDMEVVGVASDGLEIISLARDLIPDLILMDISMPISDGIEGTRLIRELSSDIIILILTAQDNDEKLIEAIRAGANGYMVKSTSSDGLLRALRGALAGEAPLPRHLMAGLLKEFNKPINVLSTRTEHHIPSTTLTFREIQVLELIASGASNQQISDQLGVSLYTIKSHVRNLISKMGAKNRNDAVRIARDLGVLDNNRRKSPQIKD